jgi:hypothetical protein
MNFLRELASACHHSILSEVGGSGKPGVVRNSKRFDIDPDRIAMGGHSAGGGISMSVGLGLESPLEAIFPMSGPDLLFDKDYIVARKDLPAVLAHFGQYDDLPILMTAPGLVGMLRRSNADVTVGWIPGHPPFYPHNAPSLADDGTRVALGDRVIDFLRTHLK